MSVLRLVFIALLGSSLLAACGSTPSARTPPSRTVAALGSAPLDRQEIQAYMNYAQGFYWWVDASSVRDRTGACSIQSVAQPCMSLRQQVVRRLLEEQIVSDYANRHAIRLTTADRARVADELSRLRAPDARTGRLLTTPGVSLQFMRRVLENQLLVHRVEVAVAGPAALSGPSFETRKYVFGLDAPSYRNALDLATSGVYGGTAARPPVHWVAAYRLPPHLRSLAAVAGNGDYVGPTRVGNSTVVYQILSRGIHRYGRPAREQSTARIFRSWLSRQLQNMRPQCVSGSSRALACYGLYH